MKIARLLGVAVAAAGLLTFAYAAGAQDKKPASPPAARAASSPCKGLDEAACGAKATECQWIAPKSGKQKPYCRRKAKVAKKAAPAKEAPK